MCLMLSKLLMAILLIGAFSITVSGAENPVLLIQEDFEKGELTYSQSLLYQLMLLHGSEQLPAKYISADSLFGRSATPLLWEINRNFDDLSSADQNTLKDYLSRPSTEFSIVSSSGIFRVHYSLSGGNAVAPDDVDPANGVPDYVERVAESLDSAYACQHTQLGYLVPPSDGTEGGDDKFDCYILNIPYYGYTQPEAPGPESWNDYISYMAINNDFIGFPPNDDPDGDVIGAIRVTCAHEYFHAVQYGYTLPGEYWYMEVSSTWMEEICYPQVNDNYIYIDSFFVYPQFSLNSEVNWHHYGAFVWNRFIDQYFDTTFVRLVWEDYRFSGDIYGIINSNLVIYGSSLYEAYSEFALWNWCTSYRMDGGHYPDGGDYPPIDIIGEISLYPVNDGVPPSGKKPDGLSSNYIVFTNPENVIGDLALTFDGQDGIHFTANLILAKSGNIYTFAEIPLDLNAEGGLTIPDFDLYDYVVLNPVVRSWYADSVNYNYTANLIAWPNYAVEVAYYGPLEIYSNGSRTVQFKVYNRGAKGGLYIMSAADELGWDVSVPDSFYYIPVRDSAFVSVDLSSTPGLLPGTVNNIYLTATFNGDSSAYATGALPAEIVTRNGDANNDGSLNVSDAVYIINFIFTGGGYPIPEYFAGDANCDNSVNVSDAVFIINYIFSGGPPPPCLVY